MAGHSARLAVTTLTALLLVCYVAAGLGAAAELGAAAGCSSPRLDRRSLGVTERSRSFTAAAVVTAVRRARSVSAGPPSVIVLARTAWRLSSRRAAKARR